MKINKLYLFALLFLYLGLLIVSCQKANQSYVSVTDASDTANRVYVIQTSASNITDSVILSVYPSTGSAQTVYFAASFGGVGVPGSAIPVTFAFDQNAFDSVNNTIKATGSVDTFIRFPTGSYTFGSTVTIPAGKVSSNYDSLTYTASVFSTAKNYLLPLSITYANGYKLGAKTLFFKVRKLAPVKIPKSVTTTWVATADSWEKNGEYSPPSNVLDSNLTTIWHSQYSGTVVPYPHWIQLDMLQNYNVAYIKIGNRSGGNLNGPSVISISGSMDGTAWTTLLQNQTYNPTATTYQTYTFPSATTMRYLKVNCVSGNWAYVNLSEIWVYYQQ